MYRDRGITPPQPSLALTGSRVDEIMALRKTKLKKQQEAVDRTGRSRAAAQDRIKLVRQNIAAKAPVLPPKSTVPPLVPLSSRTHDVISIAGMLEYDEEVKEARKKGFEPPTALVTIPLPPKAPALTVLGGHVVVQGSTREKEVEKNIVDNLTAAGTKAAAAIQAPQSTAAAEAQIAADTQRQLAEQMRNDQLEREEQAKDDAEALVDLQKVEEVAVASRAIINRDLAKNVSPYAEYSQSQLDALKLTHFDAWATELDKRKKKRLADTLNEFMGKDYGKSTVSDKRKREIEAYVATPVSAGYERDIRAKRQRRLEDKPITQFTVAERERQQRQRQLTGQAATAQTRAAAATAQREAGQRRATATGAKAKATRAEAGAAGERAVVSAVEAAKKTFMALSPLDKGALKPPESIKTDQAVIQRADENRELLKNAKSGSTGQSYDSKNDVFDAFVAQSTDRKELETMIDRLRPLVSKGGHTSAGKKENKAIRSRIVKLDRRLNKVLSGHVTRSVTSGLKRSEPIATKGKRERSDRPSKRAKSSKKPGARHKKPKTGGARAKKKVRVQAQPKAAGHEAYFI